MHVLVLNGVAASLALVAVVLNPARGPEVPIGMFKGVKPVPGGDTPNASPRYDISLPKVQVDREIHRMAGGLMEERFGRETYLVKHEGRFYMLFVQSDETSGASSNRVTVSLYWKPRTWLEKTLGWLRH